MRTARRFMQLGLFALIAALLGLWSPATHAHSDHHPRRTHLCAEMAAQDAARAAATRDAAAERHLRAAAAALDASDDSRVACTTGCCAGASCTSPVAGAPASGVSLPEPDRPDFGIRRVRSLTASTGERQPRPPRG